MWETVNDADSQFREVLRRDPSQVLLALDFDGTLAHIQTEPGQARVTQGAAQALDELAARGVRLAIITGRGLAEVKELAQLGERQWGGLRVFGQFGVEHWDSQTDQEDVPETPETVRAAHKDLVRMLAQLAAEGKPVAGVELKDKKYAIVVFTRRADDPEGAMVAVDEPTRAIAQKHGLHVEPGREVLELRAFGTNKGDALRKIGSELRPRAVAMLGDDLADIPAFDLLKDLRTKGLVTCSVVSASAEVPQMREHGDVICDGPDGVAAWLGSLN